MERPYVIVSAAMSLDGFLDDASPERLTLSNAADFDRVDAVRADVDAIAVGAGTVRADDPRLLVRSAERRAARVAAGKPASPLRVVISPSGRLDPGSRLFDGASAAPVVVYTSAAGARTFPLGPEAEEFGPGSWPEGAQRPEVVAVGGGGVPPHGVLEDLAGRGVARVLVEGGGIVHTAFLSADLVDEMHVAIAPFLLGNAGGAKFLYPAVFPQSPRRPLKLVETRAIGEVALLVYRRA
ncbi:RibD family protein [Glycomyces luteolus]|uniref:RibD family protein n=1 Tax=Glycomyces luteolus TaxID=2670330 RepID=A0A9X3P3U2_9ACTN|nr:RibD family protein [Glycomyces luteolus]MDA1358173.1 RibD family protein [Glycomyces luteolus]